jgi:hypothetical protein
MEIFDRVKLKNTAYVGEICQEKWCGIPSWYHREFIVRWDDGLCSNWLEEHELEPEHETLELTESETAMILEARTEKEAVKKKAEWILKVLKIALAFELWRQAEGCGYTFGAFVNEFGYDGNDHLQMWDEVLRVTRAAGARGGNDA